MDFTSRVNNFLDKHHRWGNAAAVLSIQMLTLLICLGTADRDAGFAFITAGVTTTSLYYRYRNPYGSIYVFTVALLLSLFAPTVVIYSYLPVLLAAYHTGRHWNQKGRARAFIGGWVISFLVGVRSFIALLHSLSPNEPVLNAAGAAFIALFALFFCGLTFSFFWFFGASRRMRVLLQDEIRERAMRLEFEQQQERRLAAQDERTRIAREMHDIVAHSLSSIITQADGARYASAAARQASEEATDADGSQPETSQKIAEQTLDTIATTARGSLAQMRSLLGILRTDEVTMYTPAPSLGEVPMLVEQTRDSGVPIEFSGISGVPRGTLPQGAELAAYRVVQEALTNILKHARDAQQVQLVVAWDRAGLGISAHNSAPQGKFSPVPGSGNGLRGMAERVNMYEGELSYGPDVQGGYTVRAHLPYREI